MMLRYCLLIILGAGLLSSCATPDFVSEAELQAYISDVDHGLRQEKDVNGLRVALQYRPTDLLVAQELNGETDVRRADSLRRKYDRYAYFVLSLSAQDQDALYQSGSYGRFSERLQTLAFRMGEYARLVTSERDTVPVGDFAFPRLYGHGGSTDVLFAFARDELATDEWVQFDLQDFGMGTGAQRFRFRPRDWERTPRMAFR